jgi:rod shape-determining protein MreC
MKRAQSVLPVFLLLLVLSAVILFFFSDTILKPLQSVTLPVQKWVFTTFSKVPVLYNGSEESLREENTALRMQLVKMQELERDNVSLRNQFQISDPTARALLPATVIGVTENKIIIDKGSENSVQNGDIIVLKDNLIGKVTKVSPYVSIITLITDPATSFTAQTSKTSAIGVIKAQGGDTITFENVVLSDKLEKDDMIITKGDVDENGGGYPPKLVVGKVVSVNKKASNLFQSAQVKSLIDLTKIRMVFVITN